MTTVEQLAPGHTLPPMEDGPLRVEDFVRYQAAAGDFNPIHYDTAHAHEAGFDQPFAVGMRQAAVLSAWLTDLFGVDALRRLAVQKRSQAWPGAS